MLHFHIIVAISSKLHLFCTSYQELNVLRCTWCHCQQITSNLPDKGFCCAPWFCRHSTQGSAVYSACGFCMTILCTAFIYSKYFDPLYVCQWGDVFHWSPWRRVAFYFTYVEVIVMYFLYLVYLYDLWYFFQHHGDFDAWLCHSYEYLFIFGHLIMTWLIRIT